MNKSEHILNAGESIAYEYYYRGRCKANFRIITVNFKKLTQKQFDVFVELFKGDSQFRFWGDPIMLGGRKALIYGVDKELWKPIFIELTDNRLIAVVGFEYDEINRLIDEVRKHVFSITNIKEV